MGSIERYARAARDAGCPLDQFEAFLRAGVVLQPRQLEASAAARQCDVEDGPTQVGYGGARGGGKSHWGIAQVGADDCQRYPGLKCLILRKVGKALKEGFRDLLSRTLGGLSYTFVDSESTLRFPNGSTIVLGHFQKESDIDAYLGLEYDVILIEEATTLSASKVTMIRTCLRTSKPGWRPRMYYTTNPGGIGHQWFRKLFIVPHRPRAVRPDQPYVAGFAPLHRQAGDTRFIPATAIDNAFLNREYRQILDSLTGWKRRAWRDGDWDIAAGQFFTTFRRDVHVIPPVVPSRNWRLWGALDYGFTHYTTFYLLGRIDGTTTLLDEHGARGWLPERHAGAIQQLLRRYDLEPSSLETIVAGADVFSKRPNGATVAQMYEALGLTLEMANDDRINGAAAILQGLGDDSAGIAPTLYLTERCPNLIETLPLLQHDPNRPEDVLKWDTDEDGNGGDDWYDGGRYGVIHGAPAPAGFVTSYR